MKFRLWLALGMLGIAGLLMLRNTVLHPENDPNLRRNRPVAFQCNACQHTWEISRSEYLDLCSLAEKDGSYLDGYSLAPDCPSCKGPRTGRQTILSREGGAGENVPVEAPRELPSP